MYITTNCPAVTRLLVALANNHLAYNRPVSQNKSSSYLASMIEMVDESVLRA